MALLFTVVMTAQCMSLMKFQFFLTFFFLAAPQSLWDLGSLTRDRTQAPEAIAPSPNHWTTRELPGLKTFEIKSYAL